MAVPWHSQSADDASRELGCDTKGLSTDEAEKRAKRYGPNAVATRRPYPAALIFLRQFQSPLIAILLVAAAVSAYIRHYSDALFILVVLFLNTSVGFYQEWKADASLQALNKLVRLAARVVRDGHPREVPSESLVPGDLIRLKAGDKVPADALILRGRNLSANEASLTGEWLATPKRAGALAAETPLAERADMLHLGTTVESGSCEALVVATGEATEMGTVVSLLHDAHERPTPLQHQMARLSRLAGIGILLFVAIISIIGYFTEKTFAEVFVSALALAVSAIPEGLLPSITVVLALGMRRILAERGLVRKLNATETLGAVTVICTDKTGTLTEGSMEVSRILTGKRELLGPLRSLKRETGLESHVRALEAAVLSNDAFIENPEDDLHKWVVRGRATERALLLAGAEVGIDKHALEREHPLIARAEFTSDAKFAAALHKRGSGEGGILYVVGAPEILDARSIELDVDGKKERLDSEAYRSLTHKLDTLTASGLRVLACAYRTVPPHDMHAAPEELAEKLTLLGYIALKDPLRADAHESIALTESAGIRTILITGDHPRTAFSIAREIGIPVEESDVVEGPALDALSDEALRERVRAAALFARVSPRHKLRIVDALQRNGEVVAMVGDGVNDAPALKQADVGVAVGSGSDVAKEVADVILLDGSFRTIVSAVRQGRVMFENIRKVFLYLIADDFSELVLFIGAMAFGLPLPLLATQILWINLVEDGLPNIALTTEQGSNGLMHEPPRDPKASIVSPPMRRWMIAIFIITGTAAFLTFVAAYSTTFDIDLARTVVFTLMCVDSLIFAYSVRSLRLPLWRHDILDNRALNGAAVFGMALVFAGVYLPALQGILGTVALPFSAWILVGAVSGAEIVLIERFKRRAFGAAARASGPAGRAPIGSPRRMAQPGILGT